jgi:hypothetical protein
MSIDQIETEDRITLSISGACNRLLEDIQHHLRRGGQRSFKATILHEALVLYAVGLGFEPDEIIGEIPSDEPIGEEEGV